MGRGGETAAIANAPASINERAGEAIDIAGSDTYVPGCAVSHPVIDIGALPMPHHPLAAGTDISAESYAYPGLFIVGDGDAESFHQCGNEILSPGNGRAVCFHRGSPMGVRTGTGRTYTETDFPGVEMNGAIEGPHSNSVPRCLTGREG